MDLYLVTDAKSVMNRSSSRAKSETSPLSQEESAEPISLRRLEARPIATLSIEAQERHERMERTHRDD